jgi:hypothetical protein
MTAHIQEEVPENLFLAWACLHQWPLIEFGTVGIVGASDEELGFIELYHFVMERVGRLGLVGFGVRWSRAAEAISTGKEDEVEWLDFESLVERQTDIPHGREGDSDAAAEIVHELLDLMEVSKIGAEISRGDGIDRSTLCGRGDSKQKCSSTSQEGGELHAVFLK